MPDNQSPYSTYTQGYDIVDEPNSLMVYNGSGGLGAMTSKEAFARVVSSPAFLAWEFELKHSSSR